MKFVPASIVSLLAFAIAAGGCGTSKRSGTAVVHGEAEGPRLESRPAGAARPAEGRTSKTRVRIKNGRTTG